MINSGIKPAILISIFLLKVALGMANAWLIFHYTHGGDTWEYHTEGLKEYHLLFIDPKEYLLNIFHSGYQTGYSGLFSSVNSYWNDLKENLIVKLLSVFDIFSGGYYYTNVIFFNFIVLFGNVALYRVFVEVYKGKENILLISCFLLPSFLLFTSSIHKEGLILLALGITIYIIYNSLNRKRISITGIVSVLFCLLYIFLQRNFVLIALLPALLAWILADSKQYHPLKTFVIVYGIGVIIFFVAGMISPKLNLPYHVAQKQLAFLALKNAHSAIPVDTLQPTFVSFVHNSLQAFNHGAMRPYIADGGAAPFLYPFAIEIILYQLLLVIFVFYQKRNDSLSLNDRSFILFGVFFSLSLIMIIGYTIPIIGAIIRYRSIYFPFILSPILCSTNWKRLKFRKH
ncbi:MAG TPA: hypothetical protein VK705_12570 [Ferruginibacter sp.]|nr:hypothetical protein [Ferruginibacter sp.]